MGLWDIIEGIGDIASAILETSSAGVATNSSDAREHRANAKDKIYSSIDHFRNFAGSISTKRSSQNIDRFQIISFGGYDWLVLDKIDDKVLLLSKNVLFFMEYNSELAEVTWENSSLRKYLNNEFYNKFSENDKKNILETDVSYFYRSIYKNDTDKKTTKDNVFVLSFHEALRYFEGGNDLIGLYNGEQTIYNGNKWGWWLRDPGLIYEQSKWDYSKASRVNSDGEISNYLIGTDVNHSACGVRPAMYIKYNESIANAESGLSSINRFDIIQFGGYQWIVIEKIYNRLTIISKDIIEIKNYDDCSSKYDSDLSWDGSMIRKYLNCDFFNSFSYEEKMCIVDTFNDEPKNPKIDTWCGNPTIDKLYLLSINDINKYFSNPQELIARYNGNETGWWLRSPGKEEEYRSFVSNKGNIVFDGLVTTEELGVRPVMKLEYKDSIIKKV